MAVVVTFRDEERCLPRFLASLAAQTAPPESVVLVDDGSTDASAQIAADFVRRHPGARLVRRPPRARERDRLVAGSVWSSFQEAVATLEHDHDVVAKLDADLVLPPELLAEITAAFAADPRLGLTGPYLSERAADGTLQRIRWRPEHVAGATKFYRRRCYDDVHPLPPLLNLDMVDEVKARSRGWRTASFAAAGGDPLHLRAEATHDGLLRGLRRRGAAEYVSGGHPLLVLYMGLQRVARPPRIVGTLHYFAGWLSAAARRVPRFDADLRELRRREQLLRVRERVAGRFGRTRRVTRTGA
ncbi:MAG: glycosyltransferase family A protein [Solirubrobacteraceae bacterium]|nr:glycosyltransferase family A protein [Solirubrobacteraceae bacterium]